MYHYFLTLLVMFTVNFLRIAWTGGFYPRCLDGVSSGLIFLVGNILYDKEASGLIRAGGS